MHIYVGIFLIAFSSLALEVTLTRILSVTTWYHLAFFAISTALLGMTAGAVAVYLKPEWFERDRLEATLARSSLSYALAVPVALVMLSITPLTLEPTIMTLMTLLAATVFSALPFFFGGIVVTGVLTKVDTLPIGKLYASDLVGAALGCLFVLAGLQFLDAPSFVLLCAAIGPLAALSFARGTGSRALRRAGGWLLALLLVAVILNAATPYGIRPLIVKGRIESASRYLIERWNTFSRIIVAPGSEQEPAYWGASPVAPQDEIFHYWMNIDGEAGTTLQRMADTDFLRYDVTNVAYYLRPEGGAAVIGVGGGRDLQSALLFGHDQVIGIDVNPIFINLLEDEFRDFAGLADHPGVTLVADEARSYLSRSPDTYTVVQMSLIDTWAATGAGAFSLSENALYTVEAWRVFLDRLNDDGIFTVSRWYNPANLGEAGRAVSLAVAALLEAGADDPARHIALVTSDHLSTLLVSRQPFSVDDVERLQEVAADLQFDLPILPGTPPEDEVLRQIVTTKSLAALESVIADQPFNYRPPTDENPYFFNMIRLNHLGALFPLAPGTVRGNLVATLVLLGLIAALLIVAVAAIIVPLALKTRQERQAGRSHRVIWAAAAYFSLIGASFMLVEIALIQRLSVFLGHPVYALGILLFAIILSAGVGSLLSERLPLSRRPWVYLYPVLMVVAILAMRVVLTALIDSMITAPMPSRILAAILIVFPLGVPMGFFFPTGMKLVTAIDSGDTPWYWALNGVFGVLCSALAVFISIYVSISANFYLGALGYALTLACVAWLVRMRAVREQRSHRQVPA